MTLETVAGERLSLPEPLSWDIRRGDPCDACELVFPYDAGIDKRLPFAHRFDIRRDGAVVLRGIVDEWRVTLGDDGKKTALFGRGLQALLLDNEVEPVYYQTAGWADIAARHIAPYGIAVTAGGTAPVRYDFKVEAGLREWQVVTGFLPAGVSPAFSPQGALSLRTPAVSKTPKIVLRQGVDILAAQAVYDRYGIVSSVLIRNRDRNETIERVSNDAVRRGIQRRIVNTGVGSDGMARQELLARERLEASLRTLYALRVTAPGSFLAEPFDTVRVAGISPAFDGDWLVRCARSTLTRHAALCQLELFR